METLKYPKLRGQFTRAYAILTFPNPKHLCPTLGTYALGCWPPINRLCYNLDMKTMKSVIVCILLLMLAILAVPGCDMGNDVVTYPSTDPADYEPDGPWERGEPSPSYPP